MSSAPLRVMRTAQGDERRKETEFDHRFPEFHASGKRCSEGMGRRGLSPITFRPPPEESLQEGAELCYLTKGPRSARSDGIRQVDHAREVDRPINRTGPIHHHDEDPSVRPREQRSGQPPVYPYRVIRALRAALREEPDICRCEMRDLETIAIAVETAEMPPGSSPPHATRRRPSIASGTSSPHTAGADRVSWPLIEGLSPTLARGSRRRQRPTSLI